VTSTAEPAGAGPAGAGPAGAGPADAGPADAEQAGRAVVTPLRRPPVRQSVVVRAPLRHTFGTFVRTMGIWWPVQPFSSGKDRVRDITLEPREGGRVFEIWDDGTEVTWGTLLAWEPPRRFVMTWQGTPVQTEVELSFAALGPELTRVAVEHRGWEALTEEELGRDCALPGGYTSGGYAVGWTTILGSFAATVDAGPAGVAGAAVAAGEPGGPDGKAHPDER